MSGCFQLDVKLIRGAPLDCYSCKSKGDGASRGLRGPPGQSQQLSKEEMKNGRMTGGRRKKTRFRAKAAASLTVTDFRVNQGFYCN